MNLSDIWKSRKLYDKEMVLLQMVLSNEITEG